MDHNGYRYTVLAVVALAATGLLLCNAAVADPQSKAAARPARPVPPIQGRPENEPDPARGTMLEAARLERITAKRPGDKAAHLEAARHYLEQAYGAESRLVDAARHTNAVLQSDPRNFDALMLSGDIESQRHRPDLAAQHYRNAAAADPNNKQAVLALSGALDRAGDHAGAQEAFARYRQLSGMAPLTGSPIVPAGSTKPN